MSQPTTVMVYAQRIGGHYFSAFQHFTPQNRTRYSHKLDGKRIAQKDWLAAKKAAQQREAERPQ